MSDLSQIRLAIPNDARSQIEQGFLRGLRAWGKPEPLTLEEWSRRYFYLSAESSYVEQAWTPWTFQRGILACMSNDDIFEVSLKKSARVGYTKMLLAFLLYNAHHRRRNQILWQPTDEDRDEFVKTELEPALRDVKVMRDVLPNVHSRSKENTLQAKKFVGSILHTKGGKAAKNYRRVSVDVAVWDEIAAFDNDIEKEGDPYTLGAKRVEGATFPKCISGSTPKTKGTCLIDARYTVADERMSFQVPCPHCGERHAITWGGKDEPHGFKWNRETRDPDSVRHLCPHCASLISQAEYLAVEAQGVWINEDGTLWLHSDGRFTLPDGTPAHAPQHIAFHVWTAYSPSVAWSKILREFFDALEKLEQGDDTKMKAWVNTTRGETWEGEIERSDADEMKARAEPFPLKIMPRDCLLPLCAVDTQDNRLEAQVWGIGQGGQMWTLDHRVFFGNPDRDDVWLELEEFLFGEEYQHASGTTQKIYATAVDSGGHHADAVYAFALKHRARRVYSIKGSSGVERSIENGNSKVDYDWRGKREKKGAVLWWVGTNLAKDRFAARLEVTKPGPGYVHLSKDNSDEWFRQLAAEDRVTVRTQYGSATRWVRNRKRNEVIDMTAYVLWLEERLGLWSKSKAKWWEQLEEAVQPAITDLFAVPATPIVAAPFAPTPATVPATAQASPVHTSARPVQPAPPTPPKPRPPAPSIGSSSWSTRL